MVFQFLALIVSMLIISLLILKGLHPILSVLVGCSLMCWTNGLPYASTFASGLATWGSALMPTIFVTLLGGTLGVLYTRCGGIDSLANCLMKPVKLGKSYSAQVVISILVLVAFRVILGLAGFANEAITVTMLAMCGVIFRKLDVQRCHLAALTAFAASVGTCIPGAPTMINVFLQQFLPGYSPTAYFLPRLILWLLFIFLFCLFMVIILGRDHKKGAKFETGRMMLPEMNTDAKLPPVLLALVPIVIVILVYNLLKLDAWISIAIGCIATMIVMYPYFPKEEGKKTKIGLMLNAAGEGTMLIPIQLMLMVLPTMILTQSPAFEWFVGALAGSGLPLIIGLAILVLVMMFFAGLGGVPAIAPVFLSVFEPAGISMYVFANLVTWGVAFSGGLPTNAAITVESNLSDCTVKQTYKTIFFGSIVTATITAIVGIIFCMLGFFG